MITSAPVSAPAAVSQPVDNVDLAATLIALNFPVESTSRTELNDLGSTNFRARASLTWHFGTYSPTAGNLISVMSAWAATYKGKIESAPMMARLALQNRRALKHQMADGAPLVQVGSQLLNYDVADGRRIPRNDTPGLLEQTDLVAVGVTQGCQLLGYGVTAGRWGYALTPSETGLTPAQLVSFDNDPQWIMTHNDTVAILLAVMRNRRALLQVAGNASKTLVLHKGGKYAVVSAGASREQINAAARHLNV